MTLRLNVRLVKGAYLEPADIAFPLKSDVDENYARLAEDALAGEGYTAIATHDPHLIQRIVEYVERLRLPKQGRFEFQMLYGVSTPLASALVEARLSRPPRRPVRRILVPRISCACLVERPVNLAFFLTVERSRADDRNHAPRRYLGRRADPARRCKLQPDCVKPRSPTTATFWQTAATASTCWGTTGVAMSFLACGDSTASASCKPSPLAILPIERFMVGTGAASLHDTAQLTRTAFDLNFAAALVLPPFFFRDVTD